MVIHKNEPYIGGSKQGKIFLEDNPPLPLSFLCSTSKASMYIILFIKASS